MELEQNVLACMIFHPECAKEVEMLNEKDFIYDLHKEIYRQIKRLVKENKEFDLVILTQYLHKDISHSDTLFIADVYPNKNYFKEYVKKLKDRTTKRELKNLASEIINSDLTGEDLLNKIEKQVFNLSENNYSEDFIQVKDIIIDVLEDIEIRQTNQGYSGLETGFKQLDKLTDGLQKSDYILLGARPSMGKTAFAVNIIENVALKGKKVAFFSLEMSKNPVLERLIYSKSMISSQRIKSKDLRQQDYSRLANAGNELGKTNIFINDTPSLTVAKMKSMCRKVKRNIGLDLVVIDYLQLISSKDGSSRRENVEAVSRDLKAMAKELNVPVIVISSLSRANETRKNKRPILSDLRETGQIEFDADLIMFLHRDNYYNSEANPFEAELIVSKQRNGGLGIIKFGWISECTKFVNYDELEMRR